MRLPRPRQLPTGGAASVSFPPPPPPRPAPRWAGGASFSFFLTPPPLECGWAGCSCSGWAGTKIRRGLDLGARYHGGTLGEVWRGDRRGACLESPGSLGPALPLRHRGRRQAARASVERPSVEGPSGTWPAPSGLLRHHPFVAAGAGGQQGCLGGPGSAAAVWPRRGLWRQQRPAAAGVSSSSTCSSAAAWRCDWQAGTGAWGEGGGGNST